MSPGANLPDAESKRPRTIDTARTNALRVCNIRPQGGRSARVIETGSRTSDWYSIGSGKDGRHRWSASAGLTTTRLRTRGEKPGHSESASGRAQSAFRYHAARQSVGSGIYRTLKRRGGRTRSPYLADEVQVSEILLRALKNLAKAQSTEEVTLNQIMEQERAAGHLSSRGFCLRLGKATLAGGLGFRPVL